TPLRFHGPPAPLPPQFNVATAAREMLEAATRSPDFHVVGFAGGGGSSTGYQLAGFRVHVALNHNAEAMAMHRRNHPDADHFIEDIRTVDPRIACAGVRPRSAWFSPDCRDFSKAKQGKPKSKRIRGLAWVIIHWINSLGPNSPTQIFLENVEEFQDWCSLLSNGKRSPWRKGWFFRCFVGALQRRGYNVEWREQRACDYGAPTIRKRLFLIARRDGQPIVWPAATHGRPESEAVKQGLLLPYRTAAECLDFWRPCPSIFLTRRDARRLKRTQGIQVKRPLANATLRRIAVGVWRHVMTAAKPYIVCLTHQGNDGVESIDAPFKTITGANRGERALVTPLLAYDQHGDAARPIVQPAHPINGVLGAFLVPRYGERPGQTPRSRSITEPMPTVVNTGNGGSLAAVHLARQFGTGIGAPVGEPMRSVMANGGGGKTQLVSTFLAQNNGGLVGHQTYGHAVHEPISTISGKGSHQSVIAAEIEAPPLTPELAVKARRVTRFLRRFGVRFEGEFATVGPNVIVDIGMRMLVPRELFRGQGFSDDYVIDRGWIKMPDGTMKEVKLSGKAQVKMAGNSVSPIHAAALLRANLIAPVPEVAAA
ncbi:MAG: DNA cytosine methyltransferase, partial [Sulfuricaulis sp.]|nr:DNA cytosine methyltransferase [Sulfuricaulis sp.]